MVMELTPSRLIVQQNTIIIIILLLRLRSCWLSTENGVIWAFVGPVIAIVCVSKNKTKIIIIILCFYGSLTQ